MVEVVVNAFFGSVFNSRTRVPRLSSGYPASRAGRQGWGAEENPHNPGKKWSVI